MLRDSLLRHLIAQNYSKGTLTEIRNLLAAHHSHDIVPVANGLPLAAAKAPILFPAINMSGSATMS